MTWLNQAAPWLALVAVWPALYLLALLIGALTYRRLRLQPGDMQLVDRAAVPPDTLAVLNALQPELASLGFERVASVCSVGGLQMLPLRPVFADVYRHKNGGAWAHASPISSGIGRITGTLEWLTCLEDGTNWLGLNGQAHQVFPPPPGWHYIDQPSPDIASSWAAYARHLTDIPAHAVDDLREMLRRVQAMRQGFVAALAAQGLAAQAADGHWRLTWRAALRQARQNARDQAAVARATAAPPSAPPATPDQAQARQFSETLAFEQQQAVLAAQAAGRTRRDRHVTFWATAVLFVLVGAALFSWTFALMLLAVVALHEGGHWLVMRLVGYQRQSVFFIPGLGAVATGEKANATPMQKVWVYLAGPMPGLVIALAAIVLLSHGGSIPPPWAQQLLTVSVVVNYFNLLPMTPLDGGRVVETLVFARWPRLRFMFALAGVGALAALAWLWRDPIVATITALLLFTLPWQWRHMQLERALRRLWPDPAPVDAAAGARRVFTALQQPTFARWGLQKRMAAARSLVPSLQAPLPRWRDTCLGLVLYAACLVLPVGVVMADANLRDHALRWTSYLGLQWGAEFTYDPDKALAQINAELARAAELPEAERVTAWLSAADTLRNLDDDAAASARALALYQQAWDWVKARPPHDEQRAETLLSLARLLPDRQEATRMRQQLVSDLAGASGPARLMLAQAQEALAHDPSVGHAPGQRVALLAQAVDNRRAESEPDDVALLNTREQLARTLDRAGHPTAALAQLQANTLALQSQSPARAQVLGNFAWWQTTRLMDAETTQAWFLIDHGQPQAALALARDAMAHATPELRDEAAWRVHATLRALLWAGIELGDPVTVRTALAQQDRLITAQGANARSQQQHLDALVAAQVLGDDVLRQTALNALQSQSPVGQCRPSDICRPRARTESNLDWQDRARARQQAAAAAAGLCSSAGLQS